MVWGNVGNAVECGMGENGKVGGQMARESKVARKARMARPLVPKETLKVRSEGVRKTKLIEAAGGGRHDVAWGELQIDGSRRAGMVEALARDAGLLGDGEDVASGMERVMGRLRLRAGGEVRGGRPMLDRYLDFLVDYACGARYVQALERWGLERIDVSILLGRSTEFRDMYEEATKARLSTAIPHVIDSLVDQAVDGEERKVFDKEGNVVGVTVVRSVKAAELLLKAGDKRFADKGGNNVNVGGITYNISMPSLSLPPPGRRAESVVVDGDGRVVEEVGGGGAAAALPAPGAPVVDLGAAADARAAALPD